MTTHSSNPGNHPSDASWRHFQALGNVGYGESVRGLGNVAGRGKSTLRCMMQSTPRSDCAPQTNLDLWRDRATKYGRRAVLNLGHPDEAFDAVTAEERSALLPLFSRHLNGTEKLILDYGCGLGVFPPISPTLPEGTSSDSIFARNFLIWLRATRTCVTHQMPASWMSKSVSMQSGSASF